MKRFCSFWSMHRTSDGKDIIEHDGLTDGKFNFYQDNLNVWWAIDPACGVGVCHADSFDEVVLQVYSDRIMKMFDEYMNTSEYAERVGNFNRLLGEHGVEIPSASAEFNFEAVFS